MSVGICKLCLREKELQRSHLLPKALYKMAGDLVAATPLISVATLRQILDYVLCKECEQRFNANGEGWVMRHVFLSNGRFPLLEKLEQCPPEQCSLLIKLYSAAKRGGIDTMKLGVFCPERPLAGERPRLDLSGKQNLVGASRSVRGVLRKYLLGVTPFPTKAVVKITACTDRPSQEGFSEPTTVVMRRRQPYHSYGFLARGIHFWISLGGTIPLEVRQLCCVSSPERWIIVGDREEEIVNAFKRLHAVSRIARNLA